MKPQLQLQCMHACLNQQLDSQILRTQMQLGCCFNVSYIASYFYINNQLASQRAIARDIAMLLYCFVAVLHCSIVALLQCCTVALLHCCSVALLWCCTVALLQCAMLHCCSVAILQLYLQLQCCDVNIVPSQHFLCIQCQLFDYVIECNKLQDLTCMYLYCYDICCSMACACIAGSVLIPSITNDTW